MGNVDSTLQPSIAAQPTGGEEARQAAKALLEEHLSKRGFSTDALSQWSSSLESGRASQVEELAAAVQEGFCQLESDEEAGTLIRRVSVVEIDVIAVLQRGNAMLMEEERILSDGSRQPWPCKPHAVLGVDETPVAAAARVLEAIMGLSKEVVDRAVALASCCEEADEGDGETDVEQAVALAFPGIPCRCSIHRLKLPLQDFTKDADVGDVPVLMKHIGLPHGISFATNERPPSSASARTASARNLSREGCVHLWRWTPAGAEVSGAAMEKKASFDQDADGDPDAGTSGTALEETHNDLKMVIKQLSQHKAGFQQLGCLTEEAVDDMQDRLRRVIQRISNVDDLVHGVSVENVLDQMTRAQTDPGSSMRNMNEFRDFISANFVEIQHFGNDHELKRRAPRAKTLTPSRKKTFKPSELQGERRRYTVATTDAMSARAAAIESFEKARTRSSSSDDAPQDSEVKEAKSSVKSWPLSRSMSLQLPRGEEEAISSTLRPESAKASSLEKDRKTAASPRVTFAAESQADSAEKTKDLPPEPVLEESVAQEAEAMKARRGHEEWVLDAQSISDNTKGAALQVIAEAFILPQVDEFGTSPAVMRRFIAALHGAYLAKLNPFHNETHVSLVTHATRWLVNGGKGWAAASVVEQVATDIAVLSHDVGHFGRNNAFCINTRHWLALTYNDRSVLENMHAATCFQLMQGQDRNILADLNKENAKLFREHVIDLILATDMASHFEFLGQFRIALVKEDFDPELERRDRELVTRCCVKAADLGHTALPWDLHEPWVLRLLTEFYDQGDEERNLGFPVSPMCSHTKDIDAFQNSQKGFLQFLVTPLYVELKRVQLEVDIQEVCIARIEQNVTKWVTEKPSLELVAIVKGEPQEGQDGNLISPEFAVQKRAALKYLPVCASKERHQVFKPGDRVWITKESRLKGKRATVLDPFWNGLVKVTMDDEDGKGNIKSYAPFELQLAVTVASTEE